MPSGFLREALVGVGNDWSIGPSDRIDEGRAETVVTSGPPALVQHRV
ncbi:MAG: hypothetical protein VYC56_04075 [Actinomycetota bacterium]|jgi:hypothetical protein|nr:hypothetical protein [Actinomycetota bacterium]MEC9395047.1 hypothetical protein [Actinomycetota bacterium]